MKTTYANKPRSLHFTTSFGQLYSDCNPSTVVRGVKGRRTEEVVGWRAPAFTIVELLIVIVVIGILAAISIAAYAGISQSARDSSAKASAKQLATKLETTYVQDGAYPSALSDIGIRTTDTTSYQYTSSPTTNPPSWCSTVTVGSTSYYVSNTTATPTKGGCPGHGQGGVEAITNLVKNPSFSVNTSGWGAYQGSASWLAGGVQGTGRLSVTKTAEATDPLAEIAFDTSTIQAGKSYTFSFWAWAETAQTTHGSVWLQEKGGGWRRFASLGRLDVTATPTRYSVTGTAPSDILSSARVVLRPSTNAGVPIYYDGVMVTEGSTLYNYADGSSDNWIWNGTANASTSTGPAL